MQTAGVRGGISMAMRRSRRSRRRRKHRSCSVPCALLSKPRRTSGSPVPSFSSSRRVSWRTTRTTMTIGGLSISISRHMIRSPIPNCADILLGGRRYGAGRWSGGECPTHRSTPMSSWHSLAVHHRWTLMSACIPSVTPMVLWIRRFCAASRIGSVRSSSTMGSALRCWRSMMGRCRSADRMMLSM